MWWRKKTEQVEQPDPDRATRLAWGFSLEDWNRLTDAERRHAREHVARALARQ